MHTEILLHTSSNEDSQIGRRIREVRLSRKLTQQAFSRSLGIVQGFLCGIERGKKFPSDTLLIALSHLYEINMEWLVSGTGPMAPVRETDNGQVRFPLLKRIPDTFPDQIDDRDIETFLAFPNLPKGCFGLVYSGEFMAPTIRDGDIIVIKPEEPVLHGMVVLFKNRWGEPMLRRHRIKDGETHFSPDNSLYTSFKPDPSTQIIGVVIAVWRNIRI
ncbi:helix-turn-helix domain-containing protein [Geobacter argillaceus]|uniref:SOS-response transcriptional repressor LexA n=1 Tax=Geobacter argillaceus TaxID=345631 RepID=A0A562W8Q3_9BACT|nr:XRE family transcriptional regulator [Geobacter argillaceus]TWJ26478.1 SOS-response transcriptional repressor LexA [Geobacter argillaceus]